MSNLEMLLAITMWMAWTIRSAQNSGTKSCKTLAEQISPVSPQRLRELGLRLKRLSSDVCLHLKFIR